ncbi:hypothetical protein EI534_21170 [Pseudomonas frederiksbergensis]|nr:hypothetical protein [Pseudomonas frederiksbergensis]
MSTTSTKTDSSPINKPANGTGTFTAKFERPPGAPTLPDFIGVTLRALPNAPPLPTTKIEAYNSYTVGSYIAFNFPTPLENGTYKITLTNSNTIIDHQEYRYIIKSGELNITVHNGAFVTQGKYIGDFTITSSDLQEREVKITGEFNFTTTPTK